MEKTKKSLILSISLALVFIITIGLSYAYFSARLIGVEKASTLTLDAGKMEIDYSENSNIIELYGIYPKEEAWATKTITLTGTNTTIDLDMHYKIGFEIEENTFSEGSLSYTIKNTLNESGTPLEDVESTIVKTSGNQYIGYGTFGRVEDKVHSYEIKIYFKNNGSSQNENQKARFKGKIIVEKVLDDELITVTFNPDGGTLENNTKKLLKNTTYGTLPIPTKEGYEFLGWNGKNILDYSKISSAAKNVDININDEDYIYDKTSNTDSRSWKYANSNWFITLEPGNYFLTLYFLKITSSSDAKIRIYNSSNSELSFSSIADRQIYRKAISLNNTTNIGIYAKGYESKYRIQLEEGTVATEWEPYYVTRNVNITRNYDHTLKAIWKEL